VDSWHTASSIVTVLCWGLVGIVWSVGAIYNLVRTRVVRRARSARALALPVAVVACGVLLRILPETDWIIVRSPALRAVGVALLLVSTAFSLWARFVLGMLWSSAAVLKQGHVLRTNGPYAVTRHPIYSGLLGMVLGTAFLMGIGAWGFLFLAVLVGLEARIRTEERLLTVEFGEQYARYRAAVPQLVPGFTHRSGTSGGSEAAGARPHPEPVTSAACPETVSRQTPVR
jgi:protein-S-isoprenylcysteine O-methyltransferase Ste14